MEVEFCHGFITDYNNYCNPRCACAPRVNYHNYNIIFSWTLSAFTCAHEDNAATVEVVSQIRLHYVTMNGAFNWFIVVTFFSFCHSQ